MAERKMADALDELYNDGVKAKMKDFIIENIDTIVAQLAGKYLTQADAQSQFASINSALSGKLGTTAKAASASKVIGGTITLSGSVTGSGSFNSAGNVNITTSGGGSNISLLSSTGSSTTAGMTQAAITNALNNKADSSTVSSLQTTVNNKLDKSIYERAFADNNGYINFKGGQINLWEDNDSRHMRMTADTNYIRIYPPFGSYFDFKSDGIYLGGKKITN